MRYYVTICWILLACLVGNYPVLAFAQSQPSQVTNDDLLKLIGLQQVQNLQCGKLLESTAKELQGLKDKEKEKPKEKSEGK